MVSPFELVITRLRDIGAFQFLFPFMLTAAIFYGLLRRSQIFGPSDTNVAVNGVVALVAAFMVWAYPILIGVNIEQQLSKFFFSGVVALLAVMVGLLAASMIAGPKGLGESLAERWKGGGIAAFLVVGVLIAIGIVISSGLIDVFFPPSTFGGGLISQDVILSIVVLAVMVITVIGIVAYGGKEAKKEGS